MSTDEILEVLQFTKKRLAALALSARRHVIFFKVMGWIATGTAVAIINGNSPGSGIGEDATNIVGICFLVARAIETMFEMEMRATCYSQVKMRSEYALKEIDSWIQAINDRVMRTQVAGRHRRAPSSSGNLFVSLNAVTNGVGSMEYSVYVDYINRLYSEFFVIGLSEFTMNSYPEIKEGAAKCHERVVAERATALSLATPNSPTGNLKRGLSSLEIIVEMPAAA